MRHRGIDRGFLAFAQRSTPPNSSLGGTQEQRVGQGLASRKYPTGPQPLSGSRGTDRGVADIAVSSREKRVRGVSGALSGC